MTWTVANLVIQIITGILGGHAAAAVIKEHSFGVLGHTIAGAVGGGLSGFFLQTLAATVVTATGSVNEVRLLDNAIIQGLAGAAAGATVTLIVGFLKHSIDQHRSQKN
jgi:uncharacterized membrane protein YeaQ/YmgE (transglycosylase-associated protein family)